MVVLSPADAVLLAPQLAAAPSAFGPGRNAWAVEAPGAHGLNETLIQQAGDALDSLESLGRSCFLVVKDGALVHESYNSRVGGARGRAGGSAIATWRAAPPG